MVLKAGNSCQSGVVFGTAHAIAIISYRTFCAWKESSPDVGSSATPREESTSIHSALPKLQADKAMAIERHRQRRGWETQ